MHTYENRELCNSNCLALACSCFSMIGYLKRTIEAKYDMQYCTHKRRAKQPDVRQFQHKDRNDQAAHTLTTSLGLRR
jgi:hypothetical protein